MVDFVPSKHKVERQKGKMMVILIMHNLSDPVGLFCLSAKALSLLDTNALLLLWELSSLRVLVYDSTQFGTPRSLKECSCIFLIPPNLLLFLKAERDVVLFRSCFSCHSGLTVLVDFSRGSSNSASSFA